MFNENYCVFTHFSSAKIENSLPTAK